MTVWSIVINGIELCRHERKDQITETLKKIYGEDAVMLSHWMADYYDPAEDGVVAVYSTLFPSATGTTDDVEVVVEEGAFFDGPYTA